MKLQIGDTPGIGITLGAVGAAVLGLCLSLFVRRRRLWVRVSPAGGDAGAARTVIEVGGLARTGAEAFEEEFAALVERVRATAPPARPAPVSPAPVPTAPEKT